jgi:hypothetical protein
MLGYLRRGVVRLRIMAAVVAISVLMGAAGLAVMRHRLAQAERIGLLPTQGEVQAAILGAAEVRLMLAVSPHGDPGTLVSVAQTGPLEDLSGSFIQTGPWQGPYGSAKFTSSGLVLQTVGADGAVDLELYIGLAGLVVYQTEDATWTCEVSQHFVDRLFEIHDEATSSPENEARRSPERAR